MVWDIAFEEPTDQLFDNGELNNANTNIIDQNGNRANHLPDLSSEDMIADGRVVAVLGQIFSLQQHNCIKLNDGYDYDEHYEAKHVP